MPVVTVSLKPTLFREIRAIVDRGAYASVQEFLENAAHNQITLEREEDGPVEGRDLDVHEAEASSNDAGRETEKPPPIKKSKSKAVPKADLKQSFARMVLPVPPITLSPARTEARPAGEFVWGQVNRLMPLKVVCRWLLAANTGKKKWERLDSISDSLATDAANLGSALEADDAAAGRKRDELLATGLPRRWNTASKERFIAQYLARTTRASEIHPGAAFQYALLTFEGERVVLTERGYELARLPNPLFDTTSELGVVSQTLSDEERQFMIEQVVRFVPGELRDFRLLLVAISEGATRPNDLFSCVRDDLPTGTKRTEALMRTHVSGVIARLCELGIVRRRWEGRSVTYELGHQATEFLRRSVRPIADQRS